jgi:hypothetical protein
MIRNVRLAHMNNNAFKSPGKKQKGNQRAKARANTPATNPAKVIEGLK